MSVQISIPNQEKISKIQPIVLNPKCEIRVDFFPETGFFIEDVPNYVYFYATDIHNEATEFKGHLFSEDNPFSIKISL
jgi:hypothetical protein